MQTQLFVPTFRTDECLEEIRECLDRGWTGMGYKTVEFEEKWKEYTGHPHAHFLGSATFGLHLAVRILKEEDGWSSGDEIISTPLTFVSSNHAIAYEDLKVVFADVDEYLCLDPEDVRRKITDRTRAVLFVGIGGNSGRLEEIAALCKEKNLRLILDAAHMSGTRLHGRHVGDQADVTVYSYQAVKNLPTADSGMICFREERHDAVCRKLSWLGINKDTYARTDDKGGYKWRYDVEYLGYKYHGNSIMAAIALVQLRYLDQDNAYRRQLASWYDEIFKEEQGIRPVVPAPGCESSRHLYVIAVDDRDGLIDHLRKEEIYPGVHYVDNTAYEMYSYGRGTCPNSHRLSERILSLPMHLRLSRQDVERIGRTVADFVRK